MQNVNRVPISSQSRQIRKTLISPGALQKKQLKRQATTTLSRINLQLDRDDREQFYSNAILDLRQLITNNRNAYNNIDSRINLLIPEINYKAYKKMAMIFEMSGEPYLAVWAYTQAAAVLSNTNNGHISDKSLNRINKMKAMQREVGFHELPNAALPNCVPTRVIMTNDGRSQLEAVVGERQNTELILEFLKGYIEFLNSDVPLTREGIKLIKKRVTVLSGELADRQMKGQLSQQNIAALDQAYVTIQQCCDRRSRVIAPPAPGGQRVPQDLLTKRMQPQANNQPPQAVNNPPINQANIFGLQGMMPLPQMAAPLQQQFPAFGRTIFGAQFRQQAQQVGQQPPQAQQVPLLGRLGGLFGAGAQAPQVARPQQLGEPQVMIRPGMLGRLSSLNNLIGFPSTTNQPQIIPRPSLFNSSANDNQGNQNANQEQGNNPQVNNENTGEENNNYSNGPSQ